ncbi:restriction endonuclease subunit S [Garciella nitratireducens]|uniref:restriction endonuclease subunit S n=1 Tax=Garciella nitratireducens TaxID=218205 RepID=UPI000DE800C3|nr:restriction endonuclease subunit S [Garciella nitratireducens]RBP42856.1 type I restriction enzyme S subunit [Garciella nitratireducens]
MDTQRLKDKILQLAIQGKLVEQDKNDEPASELLQRIKEERDKLVREGKIRKPKKLPPIEEDEKPFEIPEGWEWVRFQEVLDVRDGTHDTPKYMDTGIPLITSKNLVNGEINFNDIKFISIEDHKKISERSNVENEDILFAMIGSIGNPVIVNENLEFSIKNVALFKYYKKGLIIPKYLYYYLFFAQEEMKKQSSGGVQSFVSLTFLRNYIFPLPPLAEQKRIVEKVDELFALIDELDSNKKDLLEVINLTRNQVLQEAIQGKLVEQNPEDEPASVLIQRIKEERDKLVREGKIRKPKKLPPIKEEEKPFAIPEGWEWVRLGEIALIKMGQSPKGDTVNDNEGMEFHQGKVYFGEKYLNKSDKYTTNPKKVAQSGDILLSVRAPVGTINITDREVCIGRGLCAISGLGDIIKTYYFYTILALEEYLIKKATGTTFLAVTASTVNEMIIPLPPLAEQKRIVEKVDMIMEMLDKLEKELIINI